jgi:hypothetical protein
MKCRQGISTPFGLKQDFIACGKLILAKRFDMDQSGIRLEWP